MRLPNRPCRHERLRPSHHQLVDAMHVGVVTSCRALNAIEFLALPTLVEHHLMRYRGCSPCRHASVRPSGSASSRCRAPAIAIASSDSTTCAAVSSLEACPTPALYSELFAPLACRAGRCRTNLNDLGHWVAPVGGPIISQYRSSRCSPAQAPADWSHGKSIRSMLLAAVAVFE